ncbi:MAG: hypothetical protein NVS4B3_11230 [Gemmatimonadaceae bacterium]
MYPRLVLPLVLGAILAACPGEKKRAAQGASKDTLATVVAPPGDLSGVTTAVPAASPDTFKQRRLPTTSAGASEEPPPPPALMEAVQREQGVSRFCYQEFGQKSDPTLTGGVTVQVTVAASGITDARVTRQSWSSSSAGRAVDRCLTERAVRAWKLAPGAVAPGKYTVPLSFKGS